MASPRAAAARLLLLIALGSSVEAASGAETRAPAGAPAGSPAGATRFADHAAWSRALAGLQAALASHDLALAEQHALALLVEGVHLSADDPRFRNTQEALRALSAE